MPQTDRLQSEQEHHRQAFGHYAAQTGRRSYQATAEAFSVSLSTVKLWSRSFSWQKRLREHGAKIARETADRVIGGGLQEIGRNRKIVEMAVVKLARSIATSDVKMQLGDLDRLIRLQAFLDDIHGADGNFEGMGPQQFARQFFDRHELFMAHFRTQPDEWCQAVIAQLGMIESHNRPAWCERFTENQSPVTDDQDAEAPQPEDTEGGNHD